ncbi:MAG: tail fiber domain-containing protein [Bacteroidota bacterium]
MNTIYKTLILFLFIMMIWQIGAWTQSLNLGLNYQAVLRDTQGQILSNTSQPVKFRIRQGNTSGTVVYEEDHNPMTNVHGLINLIIGTGNPSLGNWQDLDWAQGPYFLQVFLANTDMGAHRLESVPYAKYATEMRLDHLQDVSASSPQMDMVLKWDGDVWRPAIDAGGNSYQAGTGIAINGSTIENTAPDQTVSLTGSGATSISGTYPNFTISSMDQTNDADADPGNELQNLSKSGNTVSLSNGGGSFTDAVNDADADPNNELQSLSIFGQTLSLSNGGSVLIPQTTDTSHWELDNQDQLRTDRNVGLKVDQPKVALQVDPDETILFGADTTGFGGKFMWSGEKMALRAGRLTQLGGAAYWDQDSLGTGSIGLGTNVRALGNSGIAIGNKAWAKGSNSLAIGTVNEAIGSQSISLGIATRAVGFSSIAIGSQSYAYGNRSLSLGFESDAFSVYETAMGVYPTSYTPGLNAENTFHPTDRLFVIGNGSLNSARSNAFLILKNGKTAIGNGTPGDRLQVEAEAGENALRVRVAGTTRFRVYSNGGVAIGTNSSTHTPATGLYVFGEAKFNDHVFPRLDNSAELGRASNRWKLVWSANGTLQTSDRRLKENIHLLDYGLNQVLSMKPVRYHWKNDPAGPAKLGFIAQDLLKTVPEVVMQPEDPEASLGVNYSELIPVLVKAIQEQQVQIDALKAELKQSR